MLHKLNNSNVRYRLDRQRKNQIKLCMSLSNMQNKDKLHKIASLAPYRVDQEVKKCTCYIGRRLMGSLWNLDTLITLTE
jgi:hypothetical protein